MKYALLSLFAVLAMGALQPGEAQARGSATAIGPPEQLELEGAAPAFYYPPRSRNGLRPVLVYLHRRGGNPEAHCAKWGRLDPHFRWILCPNHPSTPPPRS